MGKVHDVIIIGGGVIGCSIAYYLAKEKHSVLLFEKDRIGEKASSAAAGMLGVQSEIEEDGPLFQLARKSRGLFPHLSEELKELTGIDIGYMKSGALKLAFNPCEFKQLSDIAEWQKSQGEAVDLGGQHMIREKVPALSDLAVGGLYFPNEGQVHPVDLTQAFARGAMHYGAKLREYTDVVDLEVKDSRIQGVKTTAGTYRSQWVIVAAGAWSHMWFSHQPQVNIYPVKGEVVSVTTDSSALTSTLFTEKCYIAPKRGGEIFIGATMKPYEYDQSVTAGGVQSLLKQAIDILPILSKAEFNRAWSGLRPQTNDGMPYIGRDTLIDGLMYATGHYRNGILLSPITGRLVADMVISGNDAPELEPFNVSRSLKQHKEVASR
ncbi:glycine oxidase [Scopulibacillus daqui]|uniref:glycine oxidase n=1 Tax=Scopulibacillus daqui TaxID=1469162 RepID=A0ABS2PYH4_9BACL|nr:glycine oxidase ThiO [Scopulibacillus daqui]MBM7645087.1 glycine oxidase [Scopulibacillus daqui]